MGASFSPWGGSREGWSGGPLKDGLRNEYGLANARQTRIRVCGRRGLERSGSGRVIDLVASVEEWMTGSGLIDIAFAARRPRGRGRRRRCHSCGRLPIRNSQANCLRPTYWDLCKVTLKVGCHSRLLGCSSLLDGKPLNKGRPLGPRADRAL